jgi:hypothetical protein
MKPTLLLTLVVIAAPLIACSQTSKPKKVESTNSTKNHVHKGVLVVRKAVYGDLTDSMIVDVTEKLRSMMKNGRLSVLVSDENFGDPYDGTRNLTIISADVNAPNLNFGGDGGAGDITSTIQQFQEGNRLTAKMSGSMKITVHYKYGDGETLSKESGSDGMIIILPSTKLKIDYTLNGITMSKTVNYYDMAKINDSGK